MLSIFDLPTKKEDLASINQGMADLRFDEVQALRNVSDDLANKRFPGTKIVYRWDYANGKWWLPSRSYFRMRCKLTKSDGVTPLSVTDGIAPNMGLADALIQQVSYTIADKTVEEISNNYSQIAALKTRLTKTGQWMRTTGNNLNFWETTFYKRQQDICIDGKNYEPECCFPLKGASVTSKTELGYEPNVNISFTATTHRALIAKLSTGNEWRYGDVLIIEAGANDLRYFFVSRVVSWTGGANSTTIQLFSAGDTVDIAAAALNFWRIRYSLPRTIVADSDQTRVLNTGLTTAPLGGQTDFQTYNIREGIFEFVDDQSGGASAYSGGAVTQHFADNVGLSFYVAFFDRLLGFNAANDPIIYTLTWDNTEYTKADVLGYSQTQHRVAMTTPAAGEKQIVTFTTLNVNTPLPNVRDLFQFGDYFIYYDAVATAYGCGFVYEVDPNQDGLSLWIIGARRLTNDLGGASYVVARLRPGSPIDEDQENKARKVQYLELIWKPHLSIFDIPHALPGGAKNEIEILPYASSIYENQAIESINAVSAGTDFKFQMLDLRLYNCVCEGPLTEKMTYILDLQTTVCTNIPITSANGAQYNVDIKPSTNAISLAFQDSSVSGAESRWPITKFKIREEMEQNIAEFYIRLSQLQRPQPNADVLYDEYTGTDLLTESYARALMYTGGYYDSDQETLQEWRNRGLYFHWSVPRTGTDRANLCTVYVRFADSDLFSKTPAGPITPNILLFHHYKKVAVIQMENGRILSIRIGES